MRGIVERLRERARGGFAHDELDEEAADEIERLREHVNALRLVATSHEPEIERLRDEIERLRLLVEIAAGALEPEP